jgi:hypothetical protein
MQALLTAEATREGTARAQGRQRSRFALWFLFERERLGKPVGYVMVLLEFLQSHSRGKPPWTYIHLNPITGGTS